MGMYWFYVLPLGFLLTMYTITGYDASAHLSEETHGASMSSPKGLWRSVFYAAIVGYVVLLALTFAATHTKIVDSSAYPALGIIESALSSAAAKAVILIATIGQIFCGIACVTSASRMSFAFSRDGAIPGHKLWRRLGANKTPTWSVAFVVVWAVIITIPAYFPNSAGYPVAFFAVTSVSVIGLYIAYTIPVFLRWRAGSSFVPGPWTLGNKYKWMNVIAVVWVAICVVVFSLPFTPGGVPWRTGFNWNSVNYAPLIVIGVMFLVTIWYVGWAHKTFKGPVRTVDESDGGGLAPAAPAVA
jgi:amino acid transporter